MALLMPGSITSCTGDSSTRASPVAEVADSGGVPVVINGRPDPDNDPAWTVASDPAVEIGVLEGRPEYQLVQVSGAAVMTDGAIVLADRGAHELRFYDADGRHLRSVGREGDGPGEFRSVELIGLFGGDSILTFDQYQRRTSVFGPAGAFARSFTAGGEAELAFPYPVGVFADGSLLVREGGVYRAGEASTGVDRAPVRLFLAGPDGRIADSLGVFPGSEAFVFTEGRSLSVSTLMFGRDLVEAVSGRRLALGNNDGYSVRVLRSDGSDVHVVRRRQEPVPVRDADVEAFMADELSDIDQGDENRRRMALLRFEQMPRHETFPAYASIELDAEGHLWVEQYRGPREAETVWHVFDQDGVFAARVRLPSRLRVLEIGDDWVLGVTRDDLGVERVALHRLDRS